MDLGATESALQEHLDREDERPKECDYCEEYVRANIFTYYFLEAKETYCISCYAMLSDMIDFTYIRVDTNKRQIIISTRTEEEIKTLETEENPFIDNNEDDPFYEWPEPT